MLVVTNRLFGLASNFPTTAAEFADILQRQNAGRLAVYPYQDAVNSTADLPAHWTSAMQAAGGLVASDCYQGYHKGSRLYLVCIK